MVYDFIIVGSGSVGAAAGFYATRAGQKVLMVDSAHPPHQQGSHHGDTRLIRHAYGKGTQYVPLLLRAQALWDELERLSGRRIMHRSGVISLGPEHSTFINEIKASSDAYHLDVKWFTATEVQQNWPQFVLPDNYVAAWEPQAGFLRTEMAIQSLVELAKQAGCAQLFNCPVESIENDNGLQKINTPEGAFLGKKLLLSCGTWAKYLQPELPITPVRKVFAWHQADGRYSENNQFPAFTARMPDGSQYYGFPADNNALKLGRHDGGQLIDQPEQRKPFGSVPTDGTETFDFLRRVLPGIGGCLHGEACTYDMSPDHHFIIDQLPGDPNRMIISGLSGHGFKFASVLGEIAAQFAQNIPLSFDLSSFSLSRFKSVSATP